ncbi:MULTISPECIES: hypothetical protein [Gibbsiella]|uniref:Uncharacterized protein n=1 Tax=Gibbsiella dentisursi TaxID=796890 RepID=A0ABP7LSI1_9GAMM|nr:hypothetical protein [Gibbsiella quercinecans]
MKIYKIIFFGESGNIDIKQKFASLVVRVTPKKLILVKESPRLGWYIEQQDNNGFTKWPKPALGFLTQQNSFALVGGTR